MVSNVVTFSGIPIQAATVADAWHSTITGYFLAGYGRGFDSIEKFMGAQPFGESIQKWIAGDPTLHSHCVRTAMRYEKYGLMWAMPGGHMEMYALLRRQYKAADYIIIPKGEHSLSQPSDRYFSLQGNVDWFNFWLNGRERTETLAPFESRQMIEDQYKRWRQMVELKAADDNKPSCKRD